MGEYLRYAEFVRPDSLRVWRSDKIKERLSWYYSVMRGLRPPKYLIVKSMTLSLRSGELTTLSTEELLKEHARMQSAFNELWGEVRESSNPWKYVRSVVEAPTFLDLKIELANRLASPCRLCEWRCNALRGEGRMGYCRVVGLNAYVDTFFHHMGEEAPLVPSGTIFYVGCNFRCVYCQNWSISQREGLLSEEKTPEELADVQKWLALNGARNINHVGGDPTPNIPAILKSLKYLDVKTPQLWNSNMYLSSEAMELIKDVIDIWLPDLKYGNDSCALKYSIVKNYFEVASRNIKVAHDSGDIIIRHLVLPNHVECCTRNVLKWISENTRRALTNIMDQYRPEYLVVRQPDKWGEIRRRVSVEELKKAFELAREYGFEGPVEDLWYLE
jgi:putative pyruvate formate lyase activating enzyme